MLEKFQALSHVSQVSGSRRGTVRWQLDCEDWGDSGLVAAGPRDRDHKRAYSRCGECGRQVIRDHPIVLNGCGAGAAGILEGDAAVGQQEAAERECDRVCAMLQVETQVADALQITT